MPSRMAILVGVGLVGAAVQGIRWRAQEKKKVRTAQEALRHACVEQETAAREDPFASFFFFPP